MNGCQSETNELRLFELFRVSTLPRWLPIATGHSSPTCLLYAHYCDILLLMTRQCRREWKFECVMSVNFAVDVCCAKELPPPWTATVGLATFDSNPPGPQSDPHLTALASTIHDTADDSSGVSLGIHVVAQAREEERK